MLSLLSKQASLVIAIGFICHSTSHYTFDDEANFISNV